MSRLIDADALKTDLTRFYDNEVTAKRLIDEQPTIDAIPVVRCRDCKFYYGINEECGCNGGYNSEDWYCADGERRDDDALSGR